MELPIEETEIFMIELAIFVFCLIGCGVSCHAVGKQEGIAAAIEHLVDNGMLEIDEE
tara:strand:- start:496 stop:666 length:171 start_codon:yes stop_codon:yes gene_type:complete